MPASKGKALPLLRTINAFLRFLPRTPEDLVFRGRVHQFASSVIGIADKSAINMRGDNGEVKTTWEESESSDVEENIAAGSGETGTERNTGDKEEADGDVKMESEVKEDKNKEGECEDCGGCSSDRTYSLTTRFLLHIMVSPTVLLLSTISRWSRGPTFTRSTAPDTI